MGVGGVWGRKSRVLVRSLFVRPLREFARDQSPSSQVRRQSYHHDPTGLNLKVETVYDRHDDIVSVK